MPLPTGATLIPRKTVSKVASNFPLIGRNSNTVAGDDHLFGNVYNAHLSAVREHTKRVETLRNDGELSVAVVGEDIRAWISVADNMATAANRSHIRPGSVVFWTNVVGADVDLLFAADADAAGFQPGDRVTFVNFSTLYAATVVFTAAGGIYTPTIGLTNRVKLKATYVGASFTAERVYIDATAKTLGWKLVSPTAAVGTMFDANPIGVGA